MAAAVASNPFPDDKPSRVMAHFIAEQPSEAMLAGAREFLVKPFSSDEVTASIRQVHAREHEKRVRYGAPAAVEARGGLVDRRGPGVDTLPATPLQLAVMTARIASGRNLQPSLLFGKGQVSMFEMAGLIGKHVK